MRYLLLFFIFPLAQACPPPATQVEIHVPSGKKVTCVYEKGGQIVKHGEELLLDSAGKVISRTNYQHGTKAAAAKPAFASSNLPGAEEARKKMNFEGVAMSELMEILQILTLQRAETDRSFQVSGCDKDMMKWIMALAMKEPLKRNYQFSEKCDVSGAFTASFQQEFPMKLTLRKLKEFTSASMQVKMSASTTETGRMLFRFEAREGKANSPKNKVDFKAEYQAEFDARTRKFDLDTQKGKLTLIKVNDREVDMTQELRFQY